MLRINEAIAALSRVPIEMSRNATLPDRSGSYAYLLQSSYNKQGKRHQVSLGARSPETERSKAEYERSRAEAYARHCHLRPVMERQAAVNRALGLGRVPLIGAHHHIH